MTPGGRRSILIMPKRSLKTKPWVYPQLRALQFLRPQYPQGTRIIQGSVGSQTERSAVVKYWGVGWRTRPIIRKIYHQNLLYWSYGYLQNDQGTIQPCLERFPSPFSCVQHRQAAACGCLIKRLDTTDTASQYKVLCSCAAEDVVNLCHRTPFASVRERGQNLLDTEYNDF